MKTIYTAIMAKLKSDIPALKWIDLDYGQLSTATGQRPSLAFPCALISIRVNECKDITDTIQDCKGSITIRLAFDQMIKNTNSKSESGKLEEALNPYDTIADVYSALQGFDTDSFNALSRRSQGDEKRADGLFVYNITFSVDFEDDTAE
jgi:hypothetical protein